MVGYRNEHEIVVSFLKIGFRKKSVPERLISYVQICLKLGYLETWFSHHLPIQHHCCFPLAPRCPYPTPDFAEPVCWPISKGFAFLCRAEKLSDYQVVGWLHHEQHMGRKPDRVG